MPNTNAQTIHQMGGAINAVVKQATGRQNVENIDMDFVTVAQNKRILAITESGSIVSFFTPASIALGKLKGVIAPTLDGVDSLEVYINGVNQWDEEWEVGFLNSSTGANQTANDAIRSKNYIPVFNVEYYITSPMNTSGKRIYLYYYDGNKGFLGRVLLDDAHTGNGYGKGLFTPPANAKYLRFASANQTIPIAYNNDISINYPATDTAYHPHNGKTQSIVFSPTPGTVYGGEVEIGEDGTGTLTVTHGIVDLGTLTWRYLSDSAKPYFTANLEPMKLATALFNENYTQTLIPPNNPESPDKSIYNAAFFVSAHNVIIRDESYRTAASFKTAMSGVMLVYELTTPATYTISTQPITSLVGQNTVFTNVDEIEVTHYEYGEVI